MGLFASAFARRQNRAFEEPFWNELFAGAMSASGKAVNIETAMQVMAVFACLRVLADGVAQVPFKIFQKRDDGGSDQPKDHPLYRLLAIKPNFFQSSFEFWETLTIHVALAGNGFVFKNIVRGRIVELLLLDPACVTVVRSEYGVLSYRFTGADGTQKELSSEFVWHVRGPSWNAWLGLDSVKIARDAIGLALSTEESHSLLHKNGAQASGMYSVEGKLDTKQYQALSKWVSDQVGGSNRFKPFILDRGAKFMQTSMTGVDAQHLETRRYQAEEICRLFRVMPIMIGMSDKASTYASAEQMFIAHVVHTLMPWYVRFERSINANLLSEQDLQVGLYSKFIPNGLMRGSAKDRGDFYKEGITDGWLTRNEARAFEDMNPIQGLDEPLVQMNMQTADAANLASKNKSGPAPQ